MTQNLQPKKRFPFLILTLLLTACPGPDDPPRDAEGIYAPLGEALPIATAEQVEAFEAGREAAQQRFSKETGLGPEFNVSFCGACHEKPVFGGGAGRYRNFLLVGTALSDGSFVGGGINGVRTHFSTDERMRVRSGDESIAATRNPIPFFGTGLIAELPEEAILRNADPDDEDGDGISGRPNIDRTFVGRFGRKAQTVSVEGFIRGPLFNHLGITTNPLSEERKAALFVPSASTDIAISVQPLTDNIEGVQVAQVAAPAEPNFDDDGVADPELPEEDLFNIIQFSMLLAAPEPSERNAEAALGEQLFEESGCAGCHVRALEGPRGWVPLYSDLLLHDMGDELADGIVMGFASGSEFRTQPLWGVSAVGPYLHDGRADTLDAAIRFHGGEAAASRDAYEALSDIDRKAILAFLGTLGGASQHSEGLIPPGAPIVEPGLAGGPIAPLSAADQARFERGRRLFDRDFAVERGLGPTFNGDSCRACHFDPVVGGAGPTDVNVTRQGAGTDVYVPPSDGTMLHRFAVDAHRPAAGDDVTYFELRQTPSLLGLGLAEQIKSSAIIARADPDDEDGDGISGRAHILPDGSLGRMGWKADVPSLAEFSRDAMSNEMGVTVPEGGLFGNLDDGDSSADPEITRDELDDLTFFVASLAPPAPDENAPDFEDGKALFEGIGCSSCHVSSWTLGSGHVIAPYSDFLLHDIAPEGFRGIESGQASEREFRTTPLWGLSHTGPYMHDGRSSTIEDAVLRHEGEAAAIKAAFAQLSEREREKLLRFLGAL